MSRVSHLLIHTVTIRRKTRVKTTQGFKEQEADLAVNIRGRISTASGSDRVLGQKEQADVTHSGYFEPDQDVRRGDAVVKDGVSYEVLFDLSPSIDHHKKMALRSVQTGP